MSKNDSPQALHSLYCIICKTQSRLGVLQNVIQKKQKCEHCNAVTIHRNGASVFDVEALLWELNEIRNCDKCDLCEDHHD